MGRILTLKDVYAAVKGGSLFACGGGGWVDHGLELGSLAVKIGRPELVDIEELNPDDYVATAAAIGAPGGLTDWEMLGVDYIKAVELVQEALGSKIAGLIIGQNGMSSTLNAWLPSAVLGTKVVDALGDLRAHPTADMGSLGLSSSSETMIQSAVGGKRDNDQYVELVVKGTNSKISPILRKASDMSGGFIASCRNPIKASYVKKHAALGGISMALKIGELIIEAEKKNPMSVIDTICKETDGSILAHGKVTKNSLKYTDEAFDIGIIEVGEKNNKVSLHVMNEYMAMDDADGNRIATYPDVITTLDKNGNPISAGQVKVGMDIYIFHISQSKIPLSSSVKDPSVYPHVEKSLGIELAKYALK